MKSYVEIENTYREMVLKAKEDALVKRELLVENKKERRALIEELLTKTLDNIYNNFEKARKQFVEYIISFETNRAKTDNEELKIRWDKLIQENQTDYMNAKRDKDKQSREAYQRQREQIKQLKDEQKLQEARINIEYGKKIVEAQKWFKEAQEQYRKNKKSLINEMVESNRTE